MDPTAVVRRIWLRVAWICFINLAFHPSAPDPVEIIGFLFDLSQVIWSEILAWDDQLSASYSDYSVALYNLSKRQAQRESLSTQGNVRRAHGLRSCPTNYRNRFGEGLMIEILYGGGALFKSGLSFWSSAVVFHAQNAILASTTNENDYD